MVIQIEVCYPMTVTGEGQCGSLFESAACVDNFFEVGWGVHISSEKALYFGHIFFL